MEQKTDRSERRRGGAASKVGARDAATVAERVSAAGAGGNVSTKEVVRHMKLELSFSGRAESNKLMDRVQTLLELSRAPRPDISLILQEAASTIHRQFLIRQVTIGLKARSDGLYRYVSMSGLSDKAWAAHRGLSYTLKDFSDNRQYPSHAISKYTRVFFIEDMPYAPGEEATYDRSISLGSVRTSLTDSREGDYLNSHIMGRNDELLGWIEYSGTWSGKLPDSTTVKWVETIASVLGVILQSTGTGRQPG
jgi:hypothetical protein